MMHDGNWCGKLLVDCGVLCCVFCFNDTQSFIEGSVGILVYIYIHPTLTVHMSFPKPRMYIRSCPLHFRSALHQKAVFPNTDPHNGKVYTNKTRYDDMMI